MPVVSLQLSRNIQKRTNRAALLHQIKSVTVPQNFPLGHIHPGCLALKHLCGDVFHEIVQVAEEPLSPALEDCSAYIPLVNVDHANYWIIYMSNKNKQ